jgi:hypothetical protein
VHLGADGGTAASPQSLSAPEEILLSLFGESASQCYVQRIRKRSVVRVSAGVFCRCRAEVVRASFTHQHAGPLRGDGINEGLVCYHNVE